MSTKRILVITIVGIFLIGAAIGVMLLTSFFRSDSSAIELPDTPISAERPNGTEPDARDRVEVAPETVQAIVSTLSRPRTYSRDIVIESFWEDGHAETYVSVSVSGGITSLRITPSVGIYRRIIVTQDAEYIWYSGDSTAFRRSFGVDGDSGKVSDQWQMLLTFEDIFELDIGDIIAADYTDLDGEEGIYIVHRTLVLGHTRAFYISLDQGLIIAALEYDTNGVLVYRMTAGNFSEEAEAWAFILPDGTDLNHN